MVASRSGRPSGGKAWAVCRPRQLLLVGMGCMLVLQLRTSLYLRELEYSAVSGGAFMRGIKQRFRRNLAILGGQDVLVLQAEAAANGAANDDLARERATTFSGADALAKSTALDGQAASPEDASVGDDGMEVSLFTEPTTVTYSGDKTSLHGESAESGNLPSSISIGSSSSFSRSDSSSGGGSSSSSSSSVGVIDSRDITPGTPIAADSASTSSSQPQPQLAVLASSDAQALNDALG